MPINTSKSKNKITNGIDTISPNENSRVLYLIDEDDMICHICNCSIIINLNIIEGVLLLGKIKLYFMANLYYDSVKKNVIDINFVSKELRDPINNAISRDESNQSNHISNSVQSWNLNDITYLFKKPFLLRDVALEIMFIDKCSYFFNFNNENLRNSIYYLLSSNNSRNLSSILSNLSLNVKNTSIDSSSVTQLWVDGKISNFYYLMTLNCLAGRSFNDITQYPIFPWVISDYKSESLDLNNPNTFRDLSKPMGAQDRKRLNKFIEKYEAMTQINNNEMKPFHYGTHYSSAMVVSTYLMRLKPFTDSFLLLQDGKFGHADRLFNSIERTWSSAAIENIEDVRELIPEFFYLPEFLLNINDYKLGVDQNEKVINDVVLPLWANNDPKIFIRKNREALESGYVTEHLNEWIDLIFGYKQRGENAVKSFNVFNQLSYSGEINIDHIENEEERRIKTLIIHNFGQIPLQLFQHEHPRRIYKDDQVFSISSNFFKQKLILTETQKIISDKIYYIKGVLDVNGQYKWFGYSFFDIEFIEHTIGLIKMKLISKDTININGNIFQNLHNCKITILQKWKDTKFFTGDSNGLIKLWEYKEENNKIILNEISMFHGHFDKIIQMETYLDNNILMTLDSSGYVYSWDIKTHQIIRCFTNEGKFITVSPQSGNVAIITTGGILKIFTFNGLFFLDIKLDKNIDDIITLKSLEYFSDLKHQYFKDMDYFVIGYSNGSVSIHQLYLNEKSWEIREFVADLDVNMVSTNTTIDNHNTSCTSKLSCLRAVLFKSEKQKKLQIILGYENGQLQIYTSTTI